MAKLIRDSIDFRAYAQQTEPSAKVHSASSYRDELIAEFALKDKPYLPRMRSTKFGQFMEFRGAEVTSWGGYNGHRKSTWVGQVMLDLCAQGQKCLSMSFEMLPKATLARMARQASAKKFPSPTWLNAFSDWTDDKLWLFDHIGRIGTQDCMSVCRYFAEELGGQHVFIDSMQFVCESEESIDAQKEYMGALVMLAHETGMHVHNIAHCRKPNSVDTAKPPTKYDFRGSGSITDQSHNVVTIWANMARKEAERTNDLKLLNDPDALICIEKQRNSDFEGRVMLWFDQTTQRFMNDRTSAVTPYDIGARENHLEAA